MKKIMQRIAAFISAAVLTVCTQPVTALAEDEEVLICPSGATASSVITGQKKIDSNSYNVKRRDKSTANVEIFFHGDEILYTICYGCTNIEEHTLADENSVFDWGSISKTFIWTSIMQLWEQGKIDLDADIRTYLPDDFFRHLKYDDPITLTDIMNHKGGWCEKFYDSTSEDMAARPSLEEALRNTEPAQTYRPGEVAAYSNWAAALAGLIVQRVSGMDYVEYVHKNILEPLGMEHTSVGPDLTDNPWVREQRLKTMCYEISLHEGYEEDEFGIMEKTMIEKYESMGACLFNDQLYPCGSVTGTIGDLATYAQAFVNDDHPLFKNAETQEKLLSGSSFYGNTDIPSHSYGFTVKEYSYTRTFGHSGASFGCLANMEFDPVSKFGVVELTNTRDEFPNWLCSRVFGVLKAEKYIGENFEKADMTPYYGYYSNTRTFAAGPSKFMVYMDAFPVDNRMNVTKIADNVFLEYHTDEGWNDSIYGIVYNSDGRRGIVNGCSEYLEVKHYVPKICLLAGFMLCGFASLFILLAKRKLNKAGKAAPLSFAHIITAGQFAKIISLAAMLSIVVIHMKYIDGLTKTAGMVIGITQFVCLAACVLALLAAAYSLIAGKKLPYGKIRSISCFVGNLITVSAMIFFEMYNFRCC